MQVTLREYLELRIDTLWNFVNQNILEKAKALELQAKEIERRLSDLNHEDARIAAVNASNVSREVYDVQISALSKQLSDLREWRATQEGKASVSGAIWGTVTGVAAAVTTTAILGFIFK